jgi:L-threonylcarbamoyladenylate synthase
MAAPVLPADERAIRRAAEIIRRGGLVAFPTETVYGLGANALDEGAVSRVFAAKRRPSGDPLIVHVASMDGLADVVADVPDLARELGQRFWPGPLTLILGRGAAIPRSVTAGRDTVAVRVPAHPVAAALLREARVPIAAPSANRFSRPSPTSARDVLEDLGDDVELILDGGSTTHGVESTVVDLTGDVPVVLRPGAITLESLREILPGVDVRSMLAAEGDTLIAPGGLLKHYSPRAEVMLWDAPAEPARRAMRASAERLIAAGHRVGVLLIEEDAPVFAGLPIERAALGSETRLHDVASRLFAALRELDRAGVDHILARSVGRDGLGLTIWDRLFRAAEGRVLDSISG